MLLLIVIFIVIFIVALSVLGRSAFRLGIGIGCGDPPVSSSLGNYYCTSRCTPIVACMCLMPIILAILLILFILPRVVIPLILRRTNTIVSRVLFDYVARRLITYTNDNNPGFSCFPSGRLVTVHTQYQGYTPRTDQDLQYLFPRLLL